MKSMRREQGFTLIELMIVVAIIAIIAAIAIPSLLNARKAGNEASAISSLRTLSTVNDLRDLESAGYIDSVLGAGEKSGYEFNYDRTNNTWSCSASPVSAGNDGDRHFFVDQSAVIRFNAASTARATSAPID